MRISGETPYNEWRREWTGSRVNLESIDV